MTSVRLGAVAIAGVAVACVTVAPSSGSPAPMNGCQSEQDCTRYVQSGIAPTCIDGSCGNTLSVDPSWVLVVSLSEYSVFAPGTTVAMQFTRLFNETPLPCPPGVAACTLPNCLQLPQLAVPSPPNGELDVLPSGSDPTEANWNLGNGRLTTALPVHVVFRPQWQQGASTTDASTLGLPMDAIEVPETINDSLASPGPGGGPSLQFPISLPPLEYERTLMPMSPWDQAFPPDVRLVDYSQSPYPDGSILYGCDPLNAPQLAPGQLCAPFDHIPGATGLTYPHFDLSRADGQPMDGWMAYLRDQTTLRRISNLANLSGIQDKGVQLLTSHNPASGNALENAALVLQPPADENLPTAIVDAVSFEIPSQETYPVVPGAASVTGSVVDPAGKAVPADIVFESTGLCRSVNMMPPQIDQTGDLVYSTTVAADGGAYEVTLPLGEYRVSVRPRDTARAVTIVKGFANESNCTGAPPKPIVVDLQTIVRGTASVADGRELAEAAVDALPTKCSDGSTSQACLPRDAHTMTGADGTFTIALDPGAYTLRVRPAEGTHLPWVVEPLSVAPVNGPSNPSPPIVVRPVPAPGYQPGGVTLEDPGCNPVVQGLVRMYRIGASGSAIELGEALTDATGHYDMYLDPSPQ